ncbi:recombinase RecT [Flavobacterium sp.]|uniref:recombinase RecT n=1 Tax=Flavobacterium sp. TaxID=239 RepID=UPI003750766F
MSELAVQKQQLGIKGISSFLNSDSIKSKFSEVLGDKDKGIAFVTSILSVVNSNGQLANADQNSLYTAALMAATLDLPINPSIGHAFLVPFNTKQADGSYKVMVQFQISAKGLKQLAMRSGQFIMMNDSDVRDGEIESRNRMTGEIDFNWIQDNKLRSSKDVIGYVSYFQLQNGFKSTFFLSKDEVELHAKTYSQTYKKYGTGLWKDQFDKMASKTVIKLHLSKDAPLSSSVQRAITSDQAVIKNDNFIENEDVVDIETEYVDNKENSIDPKQIAEDKQVARIKKHIETSKSIEELEKCKDAIPDDDLVLAIIYDDKKRELSAVKG